MTPAELQRWFDAIREYVANAALGVCIGAALMVVAPIGVTSLVGLDHPANAGAKLALFAAAIWIVARYAMSAFADQASRCGAHSPALARRRD